MGGRTRPRRAPAAEPRARTSWSRPRGWAGRTSSLTVPVPGSSSRFVFTVPAPHGRTYIGLTDVPADGPLPEVPHATDAEIDMLLETVNTVLERPLARADVVAHLRRSSAPAHLLGGAGDRSRDERPLAPARDPRVGRRRAERRRRKAHDLPAHGAGRGRCRRRPSLRGGRGAGIRHPDPAPRRSVAARSLGRDRRGAPVRAPIRCRGAVRRRAAGRARPPLAGSRRRSCGGGCVWRVRSTSDDLLDRRTRLGLVDADRDRVDRRRAGRARGLTERCRGRSIVWRHGRHRLEERPRGPRRGPRRRRERARVSRDRHRRRRRVRSVPAGRDARLPRGRADATSSWAARATDSRSDASSACTTRPPSTSPNRWAR